MYYCQMTGNLSLNTIMKAFEFNHLGGVSCAITSVKKKLNGRAKPRPMQLIEAELNSKKQT